MLFRSVGGETLEWVFGGAGVLSAADAVLDAGVLAVPRVEPGDVGAGGVGREQLVAPPGERLGGGVGDAVEFELAATPGNGMGVVSRSGLTRRTNTRNPFGQPDRSSRSVSSATSPRVSGLDSASSRAGVAGVPSARSIAVHAVSGRR